MASKEGPVEESGATVASSQILIVRLMPEDEHLNLSYVLKGKKHKLRRYKQEALNKTLKRISITAVRPEKLKRSQRRHMQGQNEHMAPIEAFLLAGTQRVADDTPNCEAWLEGRVLVVDDAQFVVCVNVPTLLSLKMPRFIMSNCPAVPEVRILKTSSSNNFFNKYPIQGFSTERRGKTMEPFVGSREGGGI